MDDKQKRTLDALSCLDDNIVEKQTDRRVHLLLGVRKRRFTKRLWISVGSAAAALLLIVSSLFILIPILSSQVPVYTGMTVSHTLPVTRVATTVPTAAYNAGASGVADAGGSFTGNHTQKPTASPDLFTKPLNDSLPVPAGQSIPYTAEPGEDIYITVHFDNPDDFDIISFKLNGETYTSYMFQEGSDMENIIIKINVGLLPGVRDYTIDAIKYIDDTEIKNVRMRGDQTVQIGVYSSNDQPTAAFSDKKVSFDSVSFTVSTTDPMGLINLCGGKVSAVLYNGTEIVQTKDLLATGNVTVTFEGLTPDTLYQYAVIASYDSLDGMGVTNRILAHDTFYSAAHVLFDDVTLTDRSVSYRFSFVSSLPQKEITGVSLYMGDTKLYDVDKNATSVTGLLPNTTYRLVAQYTCSGDAGSIELSFTTKLLTYTVKHLSQDLNGTSYTLIETTQAFLSEGESFTPGLLSLVGFSAPTAQTRIASVTDENPVIEYRYTRNFYSVTFYVNGAAHTEELLFDSLLGVASLPGYEFSHWADANGNVYTTVPAEPITLFACFDGGLTASDFTFTGTEEIIITGLKNTSLAAVQIPTHINGKRVVGIGDNAFSGCTSLTSITIPEGVTDIGAEAFCGCSSLESITIPESVTSIGERAFEGCAAVTFERGVYYVDHWVVGIAWGLLPSRDLVLRPGTVGISLEQPGGCDWDDSPGTISLPDSLLYLSDLGNIPVRSILIPAGVKRIEHDAIDKTYLTEIVVDQANPYYYSVGNCLIETATNTLIMGCTASVIPTDSSITSIGAYAFAEAGTFAGHFSLTIPANITYIGKGAFSGSEFTDIEILATKITIEDGSLPDLLYVKAPLCAVSSLPHSVTRLTIHGTGKIPSFTLSMNSTLRYLTLEGFTEIDSCAFYYCAKLDSVHLPASMVSIAEDAFEGCHEVGFAFDTLDLLRFYPSVLLKGAYLQANTLICNDEQLSAFRSNSVRVIANELYIVGPQKGSLSYRDADIEWLQNMYNLVVLPSYNKLYLYADYIVTQEMESDLCHPVNGLYWFWHYNEQSEPTPHETRDLSFENVTVGTDSLSFTPVWKNKEEQPVITSMRLLLIKDSGAFEELWTTSEISYEITGLAADTAYRLIVYAEIDGFQGGAKQYGYALDFTTEPLFLTYTVRHLIQDPEGGGYTLLEETSALLSLGELFAPTTLPLVGFTAPAAQTRTASADDETPVIEYRYTRNRYEVTFHGYGDPLTVHLLFDTPFSEFSLPDEDFLGFFDTKGNLYTATPAKSISLFPKFAGELTASDLTFTGTDTLIITGLKNTSVTNLRLPAYINGKKVVGIANRAFYDCDSLINATIPGSVTNIGEKAFLFCTSLISVTIGGGVTSIENATFSGCQKLIEICNRSALTITMGSEDHGEIGYYAKNVYTPTNGASKLVTTEDGYIFYADGDTRYLMGKADAKTATTLTLPESCNGESYKIYQFAFNDYHFLTSVTIPDSVTDIETYAFYACDSLVSITIGSSVTSIASFAFNGCDKLIEICNRSALTITMGRTNHGQIGYYAKNVYTPTSGASKLMITEDGYIFYIDGDTRYLMGKADAEMSTTLTLPKSCNGESYEIYYQAFYWRNSLTSVTIPNGVTGIGEKAFYYCPSLVSVTISGNVKRIGKDAFKRCTSLASVTFENPIGWHVSASADSTSYESVAVSDPAVAASLLIDTYSAYWWTHICLFDQQKTSDTYLSAKATCTAPAAYCYSCACGEKGSLTFAYGSALGHEYVDRVCTRCKEKAPSEGLKFKSNGDGSCSVTGRGTCSDADLVIPTVSPTGDRVTSIANYAFRSNGILTSVIIPGSVTSIGGAAFELCPKLTHVTLENGVTNIGESAFAGCSSLTSVIIGNDVTSISAYAFRDCTSLTSVTIGSGVTSIGTYAFAECTSLFGITIPDSVKSIGYGAFYMCVSLTNVTIGSGVTSIDVVAFEECVKLIEICNRSALTIAMGGTDHGQIGYYAKNVYTPTNGASKLIMTADGYIFYMDGDARYLMGKADASTATVLTLPESCNGESYEIHSWAFYECDSLTTLIIPDSVTVIGEGAFSGCSHITDLTIGGRVTDIGEQAFCGCGSLVSITIPESVMTIKNGAFLYCSGLIRVTIGSGVTSIENSAFYGCQKLIEICNRSALTITMGSEDHGEIGYYAKNVYTPTNGASKLVTTEDGYIFYAYGDTRYLMGKADARTATTLTLPESCNGESYELYRDAFSGCTSLTSITIPDSVVNIGAYAFSDCHSLANVVMGNGITSIGEYAFLRCYSLASITISGNGASIGEYAFYGCRALTSVTIGNGVTSIGAYAFSENPCIESVIISDSVKDIGEGAFYYCYTLTSVTIGSGVTSIDMGAFCDCYDLQTVYYTGNEQEWSTIAIGEYNEPLLEATLVFSE